MCEEAARSLKVITSWLRFYPASSLSWIKWRHSYITIWLRFRFIELVARRLKIKKLNK